MANISSLAGLEVNRIYQFTPPEGEYPSCQGRCTVMRINGNMIALKQEEDKKNPNHIGYDAAGRQKKTVAFDHADYKTAPLPPREVGKIAWVHFNSFATIE
jgi:hypothetical protein